MKKILIADDDSYIRMGLNYILQKEGYQVYEAENGRVCMETLQAEEIDLIILDIRMPVMDGPETLQSIRQLDAYKTVPILVYSAFIDKENIAFLEEHANEILSKPINTDNLLSFIRLYI